MQRHLQKLLQFEYSKNMSWEKYFPWNPEKLIYEMKSEPKVIDRNYHVRNCNFENKRDSPLIISNYLEVFALIDHCNFVECLSQNDDGIVKIQIGNSGSFALSNTYAAKCDATYAHFLRIQGEDESTVLSRSYQISAISCGLKIQSANNVINNRCGHLEHIESNISNCQCLYQTFTLDHASNSICLWMNFAKNVATQTIIYINFRGILKYSNIIKNIQKGMQELYYGLFCTRDSYSHLDVDQCYISENECKSLCSTDSGEIYFFQCYIDKINSTRNAVVGSIVSLSPFLYASQKHTHFGNKCQFKLSYIHLFLIGYMLINF